MAYGVRSTQGAAIPEKVGMTANSGTNGTFLKLLQQQTEQKVMPMLNNPRDVDGKVNQSERLESLFSSLESILNGQENGTMDQKALYGVLSQILAHFNVNIPLQKHVEELGPIKYPHQEMIDEIDSQQMPNLVEKIKATASSLVAMYKELQAGGDDARLSRNFGATLVGLANMLGQNIFNQPNPAVEQSKLEGEIVTTEELDKGNQVTNNGTTVTDPVLEDELLSKLTNLASTQSLEGNTVISLDLVQAGKVTLHFMYEDGNPVLHITAPSQQVEKVLEQNKELLTRFFAVSKLVLEGNKAKQMANETPIIDGKVPTNQNIVPDRLLTQQTNRKEVTTTTNYMSSRLPVTLDNKLQPFSATQRFVELVQQHIHHSGNNEAQTVKFHIPESVNSMPMSQIEQYTIYLSKQNGTQQGEAVKSDLIEQFQKMMKSSQFLHKDGLTQLTVKLKPAHLGDLVVKLVQVNGEMAVKITVTSNAVKDMMESQLHQLKHLFSPNQVVIEKQTDTLQQPTLNWSQQHSEQEQQEKHSETNTNSHVERDEEEDVEQIDFKELLASL
jgi:flagellar hook-length control protein FliK